MDKDTPLRRPLFVLSPYVPTPIPEWMLHLLPANISQEVADRIFGAPLNFGSILENKTTDKSGL